MPNIKRHLAAEVEHKSCRSGMRRNQHIRLFPPHRRRIWNGSLAKISVETAHQHIGTQTGINESEGRHRSALRSKTFSCHPVSFLSRTDREAVRANHTQFYKRVVGIQAGRKRVAARTQMTVPSHAQIFFLSLSPTAALRAMTPATTPDSLPGASPLCNTSDLPTMSQTCFAYTP